MGKSRIHARQSGDIFRSDVLRSEVLRVSQSHQRQLVDCSSPSYKPPLFESDAMRGERDRFLENSFEHRAKRRGFLRVCFRRLHLNYPSTAVDGIQLFVKWRLVDDT